MNNKHTFEIRDCPFCGAEALLEEYEFSEDMVFFNLGCGGDDDCPGEGAFRDMVIEDLWESKEKWNGRVIKL